MKNKSIGLGDTIAKITEVTGIKKIVDKTNELLGTECNCSRRRDALNELIPYNTIPQQTPLVAQNIDDFALGLYLINSNLIFTRSGVTYNYKTGDKILITSDNPHIHSFKEYFKLGII